MASAPANSNAKPVAKTPEWFLENQYEQIKVALPKHIDADRMRRICLTELRRNDRLRLAANQNPLSFFGAVIQAAQLGLEPGSGLGHCYLIPYKNEVSFQLGYQGMIELVMRTGKLLSITADVVCEGEYFKHATTHQGLIFEHIPDYDIEERNESNVRLVYAIAQLKGGGVQVAVLSKQQVNRNEEKNRKGQSRSAVWNDYWTEMAKKTAIRKLYKSLPKSPEMAELLERDGEAESGISGMADIARKYQLDKVVATVDRPGTKAGSVFADIIEAETATAAENAATQA